MPQVIPRIKPMGVHRQFKKIKPYLKSYTRGFDDNEYQEQLNKLKRYALEGEGFDDGEFHGEPLPFHFSTVFLEMIGVYWVTRWLAVQRALGGGADWFLHWQRSAAYGYWGYRIELEKERDRSARSLNHTVCNVANCLVLGWYDWAIDLAQRVYRGLDRKGSFGMFDQKDLLFFDYSKDSHPRTQVFILRLIADWQGWPQRSWEKWVFEEPIFNALIEHWRTPDANALKPLLIAACDRHTHESRFDSSTTKYDIHNDGFWYDPFEVLAIMKLRQLHGLENPVLEHLLMDTPLGKLPAPVPPYSEPLLDEVLARVRLTHTDY